MIFLTYLIFGSLLTLLVGDVIHQRVNKWLIEKGKRPISQSATILMCIIVLPVCFVTYLIRLMLNKR